MSYATLQPAEELCESLGIFSGCIISAAWYRYARSLNDDGTAVARWRVQVEHDPALTRLLDLHPWEEVSTERYTTTTVRLPDLDLVWCIQHKPVRTVRNG